MHFGIGSVGVGIVLSSGAVDSPGEFKAEQRNKKEQAGYENRQDKRKQKHHHTQADQKQGEKDQGTYARAGEEVKRCAGGRAVSAAERTVIKKLTKENHFSTLPFKISCQI